MEQGLPKGFISVESAIKLIEEGTRSEPTVNMKYLVKSYDFIEKNHNFTIKLERRDGNKYVENGVRTVFLDSDYSATVLKHAILKNYKRLSGRDYDPELSGFKSISCAVDDDNPQGRPIINQKTSTKVGDTIVADEKTVEE